MGIVSGTTKDGAALEIRTGGFQVLQFAGSFDKGGKAIYQGHLLKDAEGNVFEVIQAAGSFGIVKNNGFVLLEDSVTRRLEVVGDIIQNLEMVLPQEKLQEAFNKKENE